VEQEDDLLTGQQSIQIGEGTDEIV
jgi:hypothetical protein